MDGREILGLVAGATTTAGFIPQVVRVFRLQSAREISLLFTVLLLLGVACWLIYGISLRLPSVILWNAITLILVSGLLYGKMRYGR